MARVEKLKSDKIKDLVKIMRLEELEEDKEKMKKLGEENQLLKEKITRMSQK